MGGLELWGGVECTINRVRDRYFDQVARSGHGARISDLDLFAGLGLRALRTPILWEKLAPESLEAIDWSRVDQPLERLRALGIRVIAGLTHHGSGPRYAPFDQDHYPAALASFALRVAERYPWIDAYTVVNEPVTTARFAGLYGVWYPHARSDRGFVRILLNECRATVLSMRAIRTLNPRAQLVQTDDLGRIYYRGPLMEEAAFREHRRWIGFDLLFGRVARDHPLANYLLANGATEEELAWFEEHATPPDIIGVNHYLTSDRLLDPQADVYPRQCHGKRGAMRFADIEAVRACRTAAVGPIGVLRQAYARYETPVAITEAHLGCTREEQLRWFKEVWDDARLLRRSGVDVRAVTAWALLGSFDWCSLVTEERGRYEPGVFDVRAPTPRPTALARLLRRLSSSRSVAHPIYDSPGWWRRSDRTCYPTAQGRSYTLNPTHPEVALEDRSDARPLLIIGATGTLGRAFARLCDVRGLPYRLVGRSELDITRTETADALLDRLRPWAVINAAGWVRVDQAELEPEACFRANAHGPAVIAAACARRGCRLVTFSSDLVFGADGRAPAEGFVESDPPAPLNVYGASKVEAEKRVLTILPSALVVRTSAFFGPWDAHNFATQVLRTARRGEKIIAAGDSVVSPTFVVDLVHAALDLLIDGERGIWHLANRGAVTWAEFARRVLARAGAPSELAVEERPIAALSEGARRPLFSALGSERAWLMPALDDAIGRYLEVLQDFEPWARGDSDARRCA